MNTLGENAFGAIVLAGGLYVLVRGRLHIGWGEGDTDLQLIEGTGARVIGACTVAAGVLTFHQPSLGGIALCLIILVSALVAR